MFGKDGLFKRSTDRGQIVKILAIETSHDDTSVTLYDNKKIVVEVTNSQTSFHKTYGGTLPEFASRLHADNLPIILENLLSKYDLSDIDHVAYTSTPGLIGSLQMGKIFAETIALALNKKAIPINHMHAHIYAVCFNHEITYPALALIVSGGHTQLWHVFSVNNIVLLGETKDDAVGEVYDKIARALKLGFPGGPIIDKISSEYTGDFYDFSLTHERNYNFSFSGLKTKVANFINQANMKNESLDVNKIASSFQKSVVENLIFKTSWAINELKPSSIILGGGVAANSFLRDEFKKLHPKALIPDKQFTTDNASMVAIMSDYLLRK